MTKVTKRTFTTAEAAEIFDKSQTVFKRWRQREDLQLVLGTPGKVWSFSWFDMMRIGVALTLNSLGLSLKEGFEILSDPLVDQLVRAKLVGIEHRDLILYYAFDPEGSDTPRVRQIFGMENDAAGFAEPHDYPTPTEARLKVNLGHIVDRWLRRIDERGYEFVGGDA